MRSRRGLLLILAAAPALLAARALCRAPAPASADIQALQAAARFAMSF